MVAPDENSGSSVAVFSSEGDMNTAIRLSGPGNPQNGDYTTGTAGAEGHIVAQNEDSNHEGHEGALRKPWQGGCCDISPIDFSSVEKPS